MEIRIYIYGYIYQFYAFACIWKDYWLIVVFMDNIKFENTLNLNHDLIRNVLHFY